MNLDAIAQAASEATTSDIALSFGILFDSPAVILLTAMLIEMILPIPAQLRLSVMTPIFNAMASKVNLQGNTLTQKYFAGIMLPVIIIGSFLLIMLTLHLVTGFDGLMALVILPFLLESRPAMVTCAKVAYALRDEKNEMARTFLQKSMLRECDQLSAMGTAKACSEYAALHMTSCWFAVMVWYLIAGVDGAIVMQLTSLLSRTWSTKFEKNTSFGAFILRVQQGLMLLPDILLALTLLITINPFRTLRQGLRGMKEYPSASSGYILGALGGCCKISLGGPRYYEGKKYRMPSIGERNAPVWDSPLKIMRRAHFSGLILTCVAVVISIFGG